MLHTYSRRPGNKAVLILLCGKTGDVEMHIGIERLKGEEFCRDVLFVLHCNAFDDFVVPRVLIRQVNRFV